MECKWFIERHGFGDDSPKIVAEIVRTLGMKVAEAFYIPVSHNIEECETTNGVKLEQNDCVICFTSINMAKIIQKQRSGWFPGVWANFDELKCSYYYSKWGEFLLQQNYIFLPLSEIKRRLDWVYDTFAIDSKVFIRPDDNVKTFTGEVVCKEKFDEFWRYVNSYNDNSSCLSVVSSPIKIDVEWRFIIADNKVLTGSEYKRDKETGYRATWEPSAADFAEKVASVWQPYRCYVMDIARVSKEYKLIEYGSVNMAGLYNCNLLAFVNKVSQIALEEWKENYG